VLEQSGLELNEQLILIDFDSKHQGFDLDLFGSQNVDRIEA